MKKLIKIKPVDTNLFRITYVLTTQCPYRCRYCLPELHTGKHRKINLNDLELFLKKFSDREIIFTLTGGEPTTHPQFEEVSNLLRKLNIHSIVDTNGIRTPRWWKENGHLIDNWCISLHPSQLEELDIEKIKIASELSFTVVYVLIDPAYFEKSLDWYSQLSKLENIRLNAFRVYGVDYTDEQEKVLQSLEGTWTFTKEREEMLKKTHSWLNGAGTLGFYNDGSSNYIDFAKLIRDNEYSFTGWKCNAGNESIHISDDLTVKWANCGIIKYGNYLDINPEDLVNPVTCTFKTCDCGTDIRSSKEI